MMLRPHVIAAVAPPSWKGYGSLGLRYFRYCTTVAPKHEDDGLGSSTVEPSIALLWQVPNATFPFSKGWHIARGLSKELDIDDACPSASPKGCRDLLAPAVICLRVNCDIAQILISQGALLDMIDHYGMGDFFAIHMTHRHDTIPAGKDRRHPRQIDQRS
jgi:hypothetical protein